MAYRDSSSLRLADFTSHDWLRISVQLALAASIFLALFHLAGWAVGWPPPLLWFASDRPLLDIALVSAGMFVSITFFNMVGALCLMAWFALRDRRNRDRT